MAGGPCFLQLGTVNATVTLRKVSGPDFVLKAKRKKKPEAASNNPPPCFGTGNRALQVCLEGKPLATQVIREAEWEGLVVPIHLCMAPTPGTCIGRRKPPPGPFCHSIPSPVPPLPLCSHQFVSWKQEQESTPQGCPAAVHLTEKED